jgi:hypothetical protein
MERLCSGSFRLNNLSRVESRFLLSKAKRDLLWPMAQLAKGYLETYEFAASQRRLEDQTSDTEHRRLPWPGGRDWLCALDHSLSRSLSKNSTCALKPGEMGKVCGKKLSLNHPF